jgi:hypothetical protein
MRRRAKLVHLMVDGLPARKTKLVKDCVSSTVGRQALNLLPGYALELNPGELAWSRITRAKVARRPPRKGDKRQEEIIARLFAIKKMPGMARAFFKTPSVACITGL